MSRAAPDPLDRLIGSRIAVRRRKMGLTQAALGARLGVSRQQVQAYEAGANRVGAALLVRIADHLETVAAGLLPPDPRADPDAEPPIDLSADPDGRRVLAAWPRLSRAQRRRLALRAAAWAANKPSGA